MKTKQTVGIIGAGVSGLVTAKTMREHGFAVVVFERGLELGGVWASTNRYPNVTTQNTRDTRNPIEEFMAPFNPGMYKGLTDELRALAKIDTVAEKSLILAEA